MLAGLINGASNRLWWEKGVYFQVIEKSLETARKKNSDNYRVSIWDFFFVFWK